MAVGSVILLSLLLTAAWHKSMAGPQPQLQCPQDMVPRVKAANEACDREAGALRAAGAEATVKERIRRADDDDSDEDLDPDMVLCMFEKLKSIYPQLEQLERACTNPLPGSATTAASDSDQDSDVQLANCLDDRMDKIGLPPPLSSYNANKSH